MLLKQKRCLALLGLFAVLLIITIPQAEASIPSFDVPPGLAIDRNFPDAPTNPFLMSGNAHITFSWIAPISTVFIPLTDYIVEYKLSNTSNWITFNDGKNVNTVVIVTGLTNNSPYDFRVSAVNGDGTGPTLTALVGIHPNEFLAPYTISTIPNNLSGTGGNTFVNLSWSLPTNTGGDQIIDYIVEYKKSSTITWLTFTDGVGIAESATVTGLTNDLQYDFRVSAVNSYGTSPTTSATATPTTTVPDAPTSPFLQPGNNKAVFSWKSPTNNGGLPITDYVVHYKPSNISSWTISNVGNSTIISTTITNLTNGQLHDFKVAAVNSLGTGAFTDPLNTTPRNTSLPPVEVPEQKKKSGGGNEWDTRPSFGLNHKTLRQVVECGFVFDNTCYDVTDNWHTDFDKIQIKTGETHTATIKVLAEKKLKYLEFQLGVPQVGHGEKAEVTIFTEFDHQGLITNFGVNGDTDSINVLHIGGNKEKCQESDTILKCDVVMITFDSVEPLKNDVIGLQAIDHKRRVQTTYLNEGINFSGISLNPMLTLNTIGTEKYEGLIIVTQVSKFSDIWVAEDGREFQRNTSGSFSWINQTFERHQDKSSSVMTRQNSNFDYGLQEAQEKADAMMAQICPRCVDTPFDKINNIKTFEVVERIDRADDPELQKALLIEAQRAAQLR